MKIFEDQSGLKKNTFDKIIEILKIEEDKRRKRGGYANKLSIEGRLLMTFEYLREHWSISSYSKFIWNK